MQLTGDGVQYWRPLA